MNGELSIVRWCLSVQKYKLVLGGPSGRVCKGSDFHTHSLGFFSFLSDPENHLNYISNE